MRDSDRQSGFPAADSPLHGRRGHKPGSLQASWWGRACAAFTLCAATAIALPAQTFKTLLTFDGTDGANPFAAMIQASNGHLYGTTFDGGALDSGTVFEITPGGTPTTLYNFCSQSPCTDGAEPTGVLVQAGSGNFYGTTGYGGAYGEGTVFQITPSGTLTTLYTFCSQAGCTDGAYPYDSLVEATDGNLYGTTYSGGANGYGSIYRITQSGALSTLHSFEGTDGGYPYGGLVQAANGDLYGTTQGGGSNGEGTVFKVTSGGTLTTLYGFCSQGNCSDGSVPYAGLIQGIDGNLYGTTAYGGANAACDGTGCGTVFRITPGGTLTTLYSFCSQSNCADGAVPYASLVQATDGNFYGTTESGGATGYGMIFKVTPSGILTALHSFDNLDGANPLSALLQDTSGNLYGTTQLGGAHKCGGYGCGTIFRLSVGLGPFVETQPAFGQVGRTVKVLGTNLTGATSVTFNGTPATFTVVSPSLIGTTVPAGASTGTVQVVTPGGTLKSNVPFRVVQ